jgi:(2Fe-2S) ferredoxin
MSEREKYPSAVSIYEHHVFICINERDGSDGRGCCAERGGAEVHAWFKQEGKARDWKGRIRVNKAGCLDQCAFGPAVVVYPEGTWYSPQTEAEVRKICEEHLEGGVVVDELLIPGLS